MRLPSSPQWSCRPPHAWTAPAGWIEQAASGFRKGSFLVRDKDGKTADVSVISFPEAAGGLLANVNRWRNQLKLAPISDVGASRQANVGRWAMTCFL